MSKDNFSFIDEILLKVLLDHPNIQPADKAYLTLSKMVKARKDLILGFKAAMLELTENVCADSTDPDVIELKSQMVLALETLVKEDK